MLEALSGSHKLLVGVGHLPAIFLKATCHAQVRRVLDQIRGRSYEEALILLEYMPFRACEPVLDTLISVRTRCAIQLLGLG